MKGRNILLFLLAVVALGLVYIKYFYRFEPVAAPTPSPSLVPSPSPSLDTTQWIDYDTDFFTLRHPTEATSSSAGSAPDSENWRVVYMGEAQRKTGRVQTELFDGYALTISRFESIGDGLMQAQAEADRRGIVEGCGDENATAIHEFDFFGRNSLTFFGGCLGEADYFYLEIGETLYRITNMIVGEPAAISDYQRTTSAILKSLTFK